MLRKIPAVSAIRPSDGVISCALEGYATAISRCISRRGNSAQLDVFVIDLQRCAVDGCSSAVNGQVVGDREVVCNRDVIGKLVACDGIVSNVCCCQRIRADLGAVDIGQALPCR